ncbi:MAG: T9SS type A sorting domain-containing protein [Ignavibacteriaceae bacterium]
MTEFRVELCQVDLGDPITLPPVPWEPFYVSIGDWGFYGDPADRIGGWSLTPGGSQGLDGNVSIFGGGPVTSGQWSSIRGGFGAAPISLNNLPDTALVVTGKLEFVGGGFDGWSGLRFGLFYSDSAGTVDSTVEYGQIWNGSESYSSGYLIAPNSGSNDNPDWGSSGKGSVGGVVNSTWLSTNGADNYILSNQQTSDVSGAGTYDFKLSVKQMSSTQTAVGWSITGPSYLFEGSMIDNHDPLASIEFNAINIAVSGTNLTTTGLNVTDVQVDLGSPIIVGVDGEDDYAVPTVYSLSQNYPNPFNPSTTIKFGLPQAGNVSLVVYDILGGKVAELINSELVAGYHTINFNASKLSSGVYFYRIQAGDFVSVKKLMLLK